MSLSPAPSQPGNPPGIGADARPRPVVLLVEDEEPLRELVASVLTAERFTVLAAADGRAALELAQHERVDVILTDLCMAEGDGLEMLGKLRARKTTTPVVVMSGGVHGRVDYVMDMARALGAKRTLAKPFALHELVAVVRSVLPATDESLTPALRNTGPAAQEISLG